MATDSERLSGHVEICERVGTDLPGAACFAPVIDTWHQLAGDRGELPPDKSFWADRLTDFAGRISVLLPEDEGRDFFYVIYAGAIVDAGGVDMTGFRVRDFPFAGVREALSNAYRSTLRRGVPEIWRMRHDWRGQLYDYCLLVLPVRHATSGRTRLHVIIVNTDPRRRRLYKAGFMPGREILKPDDFDAGDPDT